MEGMRFGININKMAKATYELEKVPAIFVATDKIDEILKAGCIGE
jgi:hypothetical protein